MQKRRVGAKQPRAINNFIKVLNVLKSILVFVYNKLKDLAFSNSNNNRNNNQNSNIFKAFSLNNTGINTGNEDSLLCLNNCLKWFYFNAETSKNINNTILNLLNNPVNRPNSKQASLVSLLENK